MKKILRSFLLLTMLPFGAAAQEMVTIEEYLKRVESDNPDIIAVNLSIQAAWQKVCEIDMTYSTIVSGSYNRIDDRSGPGFGSTLALDNMQADAFSVDASRKFSSGTSLKLGYAYSKADMSLLSPMTYDGAKYSSFTGYQLSPTLSLSQSLLREFNAGLTKSGIDKAKSGVLAGQYMLLYKKQQLMLAARAAYWNLSMAREVIDFRQSSLERAEKLLKWNEDKIKLDLAEQSDLYQVQAAYKLRQLNMQLAREDESRACREFNQLLGLKSDTVNETIEKISDKVNAFSGVTELARAGKRADVLAAEASYKSSEHAARETKYRAMPELSLNGSYSLNGIGFAYTEAWEQLTSQAKPTFTVGLSFIVPLDYKTLSKVRKGYDNEFASSKQNFASALTAAQNDWDELQKNWADVKSRLELVKEIMNIQSDRLKNEQMKYEKGRTTTFLYLNAQNDLDEAVLNLYRTVLEEIMTLARAELYNTQPINNK